MRRFIITERSSGTMIAKGTIDAHGRVSWSPYHRSLRVNIARTIERDSAAGQLKGHLPSGWEWVEIAERPTA